VSFLNTQTIIATPQALPSPVVVLSPSLLTETCAVTPLADPGELTPERLTLAATRVTAVLSEILQQKGIFSRRHQ
jgi:hypothetical protein